MASPIGVAGIHDCRAGPTPMFMRPVALPIGGVAHELLLWSLPWGSPGPAEVTPGALVQILRSESHENSQVDDRGRRCDTDPAGGQRHRGRGTRQDETRCEV